MGGQCSSSRHAKDDYEFICQQQHCTFGQITRLRVLTKLSNSFPYGDQLAAKLFTFQDQQKQMEFIKMLQNARSYQNIPTLISIYQWEVDGQMEARQNTDQSPTFKIYQDNHKPDQRGWGRSQTPMFGGTCTKTYKVKVFFQYHENNLHQILTMKKQLIKSLKNKQLKSDTATTTNNDAYFLLPQNLKLNDYLKIDELPHTARKTVNIYYQQVQVLRMIDHIIGALYFLNHVQHPHQAVIPQNLMVDEEGKFILVDSMVFGLQSTYQRGLNEFIRETKTNRDSNGLSKMVSMRQKGNRKIEEQSINKSDIFRYLSPQLLAHVKASHLYHEQDSAKAQIFSVGMIALHMCLLDAFDESNIIQASYGTLRVNKTELTKALLVVRSRYSSQLVQLLREMLEYEPLKRINYSVLIDKLNPLLSANMQKIQRLYNNGEHDSSRMSAMSLSGRGQEDGYSNQLMKKLSDLQTRYQKVLKGRVLYENRNKPDEQRVREDEKKILKQLRKVGGEKMGQKDKRRQVGGSQLYEIYLNQYQSIKKNRIK